MRHGVVRLVPGMLLLAVGVFWSSPSPTAPQTGGLPMLSSTVAALDEAVGTLADRICGEHGIADCIDAPACSCFSRAQLIAAKEDIEPAETAFCLHVAQFRPLGQMGVIEPVTSQFRAPNAIGPFFVGLWPEGSSCTSPGVSLTAVDRDDGRACMRLIDEVFGPCVIVSHAAGTVPQ